jgi:uncharacterized membrane protein
MDVTRRARYSYAALVLLASFVLVAWSAYRLMVVIAPFGVDGCGRSGSGCPPQGVLYLLAWLSGFGLMFVAAALASAAVVQSSFVFFCLATGVGYLWAGFTLPPGHRGVAFTMGVIFLILAAQVLAFMYFTDSETDQPRRRLNRPA